MLEIWPAIPYEENAQNTLQAALMSTFSASKIEKQTRRLAIQNEIDVIENIANRYSLTLKQARKRSIQTEGGVAQSAPDVDLGRRGEAHVFELEQAYAT